MNQTDSLYKSEAWQAWQAWQVGHEGVLLGLVRMILRVNDTSSFNKGPFNRSYGCIIMYTSVPVPNMTSQLRRGAGILLLTRISST